MSTQYPFFSYCTTYPGGSPLNPDDTTPSTGVEFGGSGPEGAPFVITDNGSVVASGDFNQSGKFVQPLVNLAQGPHRFELRGNASLPATNVWLFTVGIPDTTSGHENFENAPLGNIPSGTSLNLPSGLTISNLMNGPFPPRISDPTGNEPNRTRALRKIGPGGMFKLEFGGSVKSVSVAYNADLGDTQFAINYHDKSGALLHKIWVPVASTGIITWSAHSGRDIYSIVFDELYANGINKPLVFDNIVWN